MGPDGLSRHGRAVDADYNPDQGGPPALLGPDDLVQLAQDIKIWAQDLGFQRLGIADLDLAYHEARLLAWLAQGRQGEMAYMARHGLKRSRPAELVPGTLRVISVRMDYMAPLPPRGLEAREKGLSQTRQPLTPLPPRGGGAGEEGGSQSRQLLSPLPPRGGGVGGEGVNPSRQSPPRPQEDAWRQLEDPGAAFISRYALGRDYHKVLRQRLQRLADRIRAAIGPFGYRAFVDSAPVLEKALAERAGLGWIGKHTNLVDVRAGSWFFLGELFVDLPLPTDPPATNHCGRCQACLAACPTGAILAPYELDARRCISYLTIELKGPIPLALRPLIGNRIFGCDDCQLVCPWNRFARLTREPDFHPRQDLAVATLIDLLAWDEGTFLRRTEGSAIRRIGHDQWLRNLAVALGNAPASPRVVAALEARRHHPSALVREHIAWALARQGGVDS